jgi:hypothetical protein
LLCALAVLPLLTLDLLRLLVLLATLPLLALHLLHLHLRGLLRALAALPSAALRGALFDSRGTLFGSRRLTHTAILALLARSAFAPVPAALLRLRRHGGDDQGGGQSGEAAILQKLSN